LVLWYFHLVTPISLFANLVVVPIAFFVIAIALLSLVSAPLLPWLTVIFNNANWALATPVIGVVHLFAQIPGGHFYIEEPHWPEKLVAKITVLDLGAGDNFRLSREVTAQVLFPPRSFSSPVADDQAYVIRVLVGPAASILFTSDAGIKTEQALLARHSDLRSDVVIKGQHHSGESGS